MKTTKTKAIKIEQNEMELAAKYFVLSNCALLDLVRNPYNLLNEYSNVNGIVHGETGTSLDDELKYWQKEVKNAKQGEYVYQEWQTVRTKYIKIN